LQRHHQINEHLDVCGINSINLRDLTCGLVSNHTIPKYIEASQMLLRAIKASAWTQISGLTDTVPGGPLYDGFDIFDWNLT